MTKQEDKWESKFGEDYTSRNPHSVEEMDSIHLDLKGVKKTHLVKRFFEGVDAPNNVLEVGSNMGLTLQILNRCLGFNELYGIEINPHAIDLAKESTIGQEIYISKGSALDIPFKDGFFEMVITNGLLIHISPDDLNQVMDEMHRCTSRYIWGYEYYSPKMEEVVYRGESGLLWKRDFAKSFMDRFDDLELVKSDMTSYIKHPELVDAMYLLEKKK